MVLSCVFPGTPCFFSGKNMKNYQSRRFEVAGSFPPLKPEGQKVIGCREAQIIQLFDELSLSVAVGNVS